MPTREHIPNVYRIGIGGYTREFARDDLETAALLLLEFRDSGNVGSTAAQMLESD